jgi:hypothetical protein
MQVSDCGRASNEPEVQRERAWDLLLPGPDESVFEKTEKENNVPQIIPFRT